VVNLTQLGGGSITLTNTGSTFGGVTTIENGTIIVSANVLPNQTGPLGLANSAVLVGNTSGSSPASLLVDTAGVQFGRDVQLQSGNTGVSTVGGINTSGTVSYTGNIVLGTASSAAMPLTVTAAPGGTVVFSGRLERNADATGSKDSVTMVGGGTVVLSGANNNYSGATLVQNGTLVAGGVDNTLPATTAVSLGDAQGDSGVLQIGSAVRPINQTITGLAVVGSGSASAVVGGYAGANSTLTVTTTAAGTYGGTLGGSGAVQNNLNFGLSGSGQLALTGSNSYTGTTTVSGGTLAAGSTTAFGVNSALTVSTGAAVLLGGNSLTIGSLAGSGILANANSAAAQLTVGTDNTSTLFTGLLQDGTGGGPLSLDKTGNGTLTLGGTHTYTGATTVAAGVLQLQGAASLASSVTVSSGAGFGVVDTSTPATANLGSTLAFGAAAGGATSLTFNLLGGWSTTTPLLAVSGAVTTSGTTTINVASNIVPPAGSYTLLDYGSLGGLGFNGFALAVGNPQVVATLQNDTANNSLVLNVISTDASKWSGAVNGTWDVNTTANWTLLSSGASATYQQGNNVQFDDTGANAAINLPGTVTPSSVQFSNNNLAYSVSGPGKISGATAVVLTGSGLVTLNTNNDYTGGTYVNGGTLQLGSGGTSGSVAGNIADNALVVFNRSDSPTFAGIISGTGAVAQSGSGLLTLLGSNAYSGLTTVSAGSLQIGNGGLSGAVAGNILNNSTVIFNRADSPLYAGSISGSGALVQQGAGTIVLTGSNTYSGGTSINSGILQIGNGGAAGSIAGDVLDNGTLIVNRSDNPTFAGAISGAGGLVQQGAGALTLTANNSYGGGTTIGSGTLQLGAGGTSGGLAGNVFIGGTLAVNRSDNYLLDGTLSGPGRLAQIGSGATTVSGTNSYTGGTTINGGVVSIGNYQNLGYGNLSINGGTLQITGDMGQVTGGVGDPTTVSGTEFAQNIAVGAKGATIDTGSHWFTTNGQVTGAGTLTKLGTGTWYVRYGMGGSSFTGNLNILAGTVLDDYNNLTGGNTDAISDTTVVIVAAGATWDDSWGNGEALGAIAGAGDVLEANNYNMSFYSTTSQTFSGRLRVATNSVVAVGGNTNISEVGGGSITFTSTASDFGGTTTITDGTLVVGASVLPNQTGPLGLTTSLNSTVYVGNTSGSSNASLLMDTAGTFGRSVQLQSGNTGISTIGGTNTSGVVDYTGNVTLGTNSANAMPLTITAASGGTVEIDGQIAHGSTLGSADSVTKVGGGTLVLTNPENNFQGGLIVGQGAVVLDAAGALPAGTSLAVAGGATLDLHGFGETVSTLDGNGTILNATSGTANAAVLTVTAGGQFAGVIQDGGLGGNAPTGLVLSGGTLTLGGADTYSGGTVVNYGTLVALTSTALPDGSALTVGDGTAFSSDASAISSRNGAAAPVSGVAGVPEPGTVALLVAAGAGLAAWRLRRRGATCGR
jgi:autotransporter-associated beta strand protein